MLPTRDDPDWIIVVCLSPARARRRGLRHAARAPGSSGGSTPVTTGAGTNHHRRRLTPAAQERAASWSTDCPAETERLPTPPPPGSGGRSRAPRSGLAVLRPADRLRRRRTRQLEPPTWPSRSRPSPAPTTLWTITIRPADHLPERRAAHRRRGHRRHVPGAHLPAPLTGPARRWLRSSLATTTGARRATSFTMQVAVVARSPASLTSPAGHDPGAVHAAGGRRRAHRHRRQQRPPDRDRALHLQELGAQQPVRDHQEHQLLAQGQQRRAQLPVPERRSRSKPIPDSNTTCGPPPSTRATSTSSRPRTR